MPIKRAKSENLNKSSCLLSIIGKNSNFLLRDLAPFASDGNRSKVPFEIKPYLVGPEKLETISCLPSLHRGHFQFNSSEFECATKI